MKKQQKPITTAEFFNLICDNLRSKNRIPDNILDYSLAAEWKAEPIRTYEFSIRNNLDYGGNEGIYLDVWIEISEDGKRHAAELGTFKTLDTSPEAMSRMAQLLADFIIEENAYVNEHLDDFTWTGADVYALNDDGERTGWGFSCRTMEAALKRKDEMAATHPRVAVRDNATRKVTVYETAV